MPSIMSPKDEEVTVNDSMTPATSKPARMDGGLDEELQC
jgi:hypothetical protein